MKLHQVLCEEVHELKNVASLSDLIDPKTKKYYTGEVNVTGSVNLVQDLVNAGLRKLPVQFGKVHGSFYCNHNDMNSLEGAPREISKDFVCNFNSLKSLEGVHKIIKKAKTFSMNGNPIKSGGIGLLLIEGMTRIYADPPAFEIIEKYLGQGKKGLLTCQEELIEAGLEEYAKL